MDLLLAVTALREVAEYSGVAGAAWVAQSAPTAPPYLRAVARLTLRPRLEVGAQLFLLRDLLFRSVQVSLRLSPDRDPDDDVGAQSLDPTLDNPPQADSSAAEHREDHPGPPWHLSGYGLTLGTGHEFELGPGGRLRSTKGVPFITLSAWARQVAGRGVQTTQMLSFLHYPVPGRSDLFFFFTDVREVYPNGPFWGAELQVTRSPTGPDHIKNAALAFGYFF